MEDLKLRVESHLGPRSRLGLEGRGGSPSHTFTQGLHQPWFTQRLGGADLSAVCLRCPWVTHLTVCWNEAHGSNEDQGASVKKKLERTAITRL